MADSYNQMHGSTPPTLSRKIRTRVFDWLAGWGFEIHDDEQLRNKKYNLVIFAFITSVSAGIWSTVLLTSKLPQPAIIPLSYILITLLNTRAYLHYKNIKITATLQVALSILLPFVLQWMLGGFASSGVVMLWSILGLLGSVLLLSRSSTQIWFVIFILLTFISVMLESWLNGHHFKGFSAMQIQFLFLFNLFTVIGIVFSLTTYAIRRNEEANQSLHGTLNELSISVQLLSETQEQVSQQSEVISLKSKKIETQNQELHDSLQYAKRLQDAVFSKHSELPLGVKDWFFFSRPFGFVSGDFYWSTSIDRTGIIVLADCTGHGVPGALLTMLGSSLLDQIVNELKVTDPQTILLKLNYRITRLLKGSNNERIPDGMDISICTIDPAEKMITFGGAMQSLFLVRNGELHVLKGERISIGEDAMPTRPWTNQVRHLRTGDMLYLATDGYRDQFGGQENKKFMLGRFKELLVGLAEQPLSEQHGMISDRFDSWKGDLPQTDDVTVIGLRV